METLKRTIIFLLWLSVMKIKIVTNQTDKFSENDCLQSSLRDSGDSGVNPRGHDVAGHYPVIQLQPSQYQLAVLAHADPGPEQLVSLAVHADHHALSGHVETHNTRDDSWDSRVQTRVVIPLTLVTTNNVTRMLDLWTEYRYEIHESQL